MTDLAFIPTSDLVAELMSRYDVAVFCAGKQIAGHFTTYNQWKSAYSPHSAIRLMEQFKYDILRKMAEKSKPVKDDEPSNE
jgi:hypothetical protein